MIIAKQFLLLGLLMTSVISVSLSQSKNSERDRKAIYALIDQYSVAREKRDTILLKSILTNDIDQLVSTGEWRNGIKTATAGMMNSSATAPGTRTLTVEKIRFLDQACAVVDCRYEIKNNDGSTRKMWSTFIVVSDRNQWKISAIRNMLPSSQ